MAGHAVRQLYLDAGAVDVAVETGDAELLDAVHRRWRDMVATRTYLTGGLGSRHAHEAFGDPYELPPDRAYAETCAAIASVMLAVAPAARDRRPRLRRRIERAIVQRRAVGRLDATGTGSSTSTRSSAARTGSPPTRAPASASRGTPARAARRTSCGRSRAGRSYLATTDEARRPGPPVRGRRDRAPRSRRRPGRLAVETDYPWERPGPVTSSRPPTAQWTLALRVPGLGDGRDRRLGAAGRARTCRPPATGDGPATRPWRAGDAVDLDLAMPARITEPAPRVDAIRGCVALERGPLVYAIETADLPAGVEVEDVRLAPTPRPEPVARPDLGPDVIGLSVAATTADGEALDLAAVPYHAWANRSVEAMRVWIPRADLPGSGRRPRG